jgi:hypothetical protein
MDNQLGHPASESLLVSVANLFQNEQIFSRRNRHIIFVCGGNGKRKLRPRFLTYARSNIPNMRMFLAETAAKDLITQGEPVPLDIAEFEELIATVSDCVLIFPESAGSIAEVAFFSRHPDISQKILVAGNQSLQAQDSFINLGPVATIDKKSIFKPALQIDYKAPNFVHIKERLERRISVHSRKRFVYRRFGDLTPQLKLFVLFELVRIFGVINFIGIERCVDKCFGVADTKELKRLLSILCAANYIKRLASDGQYLGFMQNGDAFLEYTPSIFNKLTTSVADYYRKYEPNAYALLKRVHR